LGILPTQKKERSQKEHRNLNRYIIIPLGILPTQKYRKNPEKNPEISTAI